MAQRCTVAEENDKPFGVLLSVPLPRPTFLLAKTTAMILHVVAALIASVAVDPRLTTSGTAGVAGAIRSTGR